MNFEFLIIFNLVLYLIGFLGLLSINNSRISEISSWSSIFLNITGLILALNFQLNYTENLQLSYRWFDLGHYHFKYQMIFNPQSTFMYVLIQTISLAVQLFSTKYLRGDTGISRYFAFINLFVFAMLCLVLAGNLFQLYFFWELVGICSYFLIGFWYEKKSANAASIKAFLINRIGDLFFLCGIVMILLSCKTLSFNDLNANIVFHSLPGMALSPLEIKHASVLLIFAGVISKSAQFPLQTWLPDAMEGPTPASALIHAATMVVAGVFLLGRIFPLIDQTTGFYIALIGGITSVMGGFSAIFQNDIKKVLAYSTISQIGIMILAMGIGAKGAAFFHLTTHAFFKAGLFLIAGTVISYCHHNQDMRKMGNLGSSLPVLFFSYLICGSALIGLPFTSGYLSKESILLAAVNYGYNEADLFNSKSIILLLLLISTFLTSFYVVRQFVLIFFDRDEKTIETSFY